VPTVDAEGHQHQPRNMPDILSRILYRLSLLALPLLLAQGLWARRVTPRLPEGDDAPDGSVPGEGASLELVVLGESTTAGVGVASHDLGLAGSTARALARRLDRSVHWRALGVNGFKAASVRRELVPRIPQRPAGLVVIALGVNDTAKLTSPRRWQRELDALIDAARERTGPCPVVLAAVPPLGRFPALPRPLRWTLGLRARELDRRARELAATMTDVYHVPFTPADEPDLFAADGYHPSERGYALWGEILAHAVPPRRLTPPGRSGKTDAG